MKAPFFSTARQFERAVSALERILNISDEFEETHAIWTPYRILSLLENRTKIGKWLAEVKIRELKEILYEELCDMVIPAIVDAGENYVQMVELRHRAVGLSSAPQALRDKFSILLGSSYVDYINNKIPKGYGFITYPGYLLMQPRDFVRTFPRYPERYFASAYPVIYELEGLQCRDTTAPMPGWLAFPFIKPDKMRDQVPLVRAKTHEAVVAIEKLNGQLIGLGGWLASLTDGGAYLLDKTTANVTTGHAYTIANVINMMLHAARAAGLRLGDATVAVVGAAGSVGSGLAMMSALQGVQRLILIDTRSVAPTMQRIQAVSRVPLAVGSIEQDIGHAHIVLIATSSANIIFHPQDFKPGAIILDDSQPKNLTADFMFQREDIMVLEAGAVQLPQDRVYKIRRAFGPKLKPFHWKHINIPMAATDEVPSCLAEVMIWNMLGEHRRQYSIGKADPELAAYLSSKGAALGFAPAPLQGFGKPVGSDRLRDLQEIYRKNTPDAASHTEPGGDRYFISS